MFQKDGHRHFANVIYNPLIHRQSINHLQAANPYGCVHFASVRNTIRDPKLHIDTAAGIGTSSQAIGNLPPPNRLGGHPSTHLL